MPETRTKKGTDTGVSGIELGNSSRRRRSKYHVVKKGETVGSIALKLGISSKKIITTSSDALGGIGKLIIFPSPFPAPISFINPLPGYNVLPS